VNLSSFNTYCASLPHSKHVIQWGGADVWKVAGKLFAIAREGEDGFQVTFPAPYLASRGMKWIQHYGEPGLDDENLRIHIEASYHMAIKRLTQKNRAELGL